jgi:hypothetical protein
MKKLLFTLTLVALFSVSKAQQVQKTTTVTVPTTTIVNSDGTVSTVTVAPTTQSPAVIKSKTRIKKTTK